MPRRRAVAKCSPRDDFEALFTSHYWSVRAFLLRRAPPAVVDDLVGETFLVAWRRLDEIGPDPLPWLLGVARRTLANQLRAERRRGALAGRLASLSHSSPEAWESPGEMGAELAHALRQLSEREREALLLVAWEGLDPKRAARVVGCTPSAFRVRLHRARHHIARELSGETDQPANSHLAQEVR
jgi:RNA polymerase sigma-70 factor (ECF subfamily)